MSYRDLAFDAGYRGQEQDQVAEQLEHQDRQRSEQEFNEQCECEAWIEKLWRQEESWNELLKGNPFTCL